VILVFAGISPMLLSLAEGFSVGSFFSSLILHFLVFLLPLTFYSRTRSLDPISGFRIRSVSAKKIPFLLLMTALLVIGIFILRYFGLFFFDSALVDTPSVLPIRAVQGNRFLMFFSAILIPAVLEEVLFRGLLLREYSVYGAFWAIGISALMDAMLHLSLSNFVYYLFVGILLGVITHIADSIVPALIIHTGLNASYYFFRPSAVEYLRQAGKSPLLPYLLMGLFLLVIVLLFSRLETVYQDRVYGEILESRKEMLRKEVEKARMNRGEEEEEEKFTFSDSFRDIYLSPSFLVCVVIFICLLFGFF
jgi:membrane protease YdiL (CAAX protease family)